MTQILIAFASAFWLGILTSISPCPLATNIAAVSFLSKRITHPLVVLCSGLLYSLGRMVTYAVLGVLLISSVLSVPALANFLQKYMNKILGPVLILTGLFLLDVLRLNISGLMVSQEKQESLANSGIKGAFILGIIFALAFCPVSAALFFGSLIPLSLSNRFGITLPFIYGIATGLPVLVFSILISLGAKTISKWFKRVSQFEMCARKITGIIFILAGVYYILAYFLGGNK